MPIVDLQHRYRELGRIRLGHQVPYGNEGRKRAASLQSFRLTSPERRYIEQAAAIFGGEVKPWRSPRGEEFEVITQTAEIPVLVPQQDLVNNQFYELWGVPEGERGVRRMRRCDGAYESITGGKCLCDPEKRDCKPTTHLVVMIKALPDIGVWRATSHGFNSAAELPASVHTLGTMMAFGAEVDALLVTAPRSSTNQKGQKRNFRVIEIRIPHTTQELIARLPENVNQSEFVAALTAGPQAAVPLGRPALPPTPEAAALPASAEPVSTPYDDGGPVEGENADFVPSSEGEKPSENMPGNMPQTVVDVAESWPTDEPEPDDEDRVATTREFAELELAKLKTESARQDTLLSLLDNMPADTDTMEQWERWIRMVFGLMARQKYWTDKAMHAVLAKEPYNSEHLTSLNKGPLVKLGKQLHEQAVATVNG